MIHGFRTGDIVKAIVTKGKKTGTYTGRVAIRAIGFFNITNCKYAIQGIGHKYCVSLHKSDGYDY